MKRLGLFLLLTASMHHAIAQELKSAALYAEKIHCEARAALIAKTLRNVPGVAKVSVQVDKREIHVQYDSAKTSVDKFSTVLAAKGYTATVKSAGL